MDSHPACSCRSNPVWRATSRRGGPDAAGLDPQEPCARWFWPKPWRRACGPETRCAWPLRAICSRRCQGPWMRSCSQTRKRIRERNKLHASDRDDFCGLPDASASPSGMIWLARCFRSSSAREITKPQQPHAILRHNGQRT